MAKQHNTESNKKSKAAKKTKVTKLASSWQILSRTFSLLIVNWKTLALIAFVHFAVSVALSGTQNNYQPGQLESIIVGAVFSMSYLWVFREVRNNQATSAKQALYRGPAQIVPFLLVLLMFFVQMLPFAIGLFIFQIGVGGGVTINIGEQLLFGTIWLVLALPSIYWVTTTTFGMVVVSIAGVNPLQAWRAARKLVKPYFIASAGRLLVIVTLALVGLAATVALAVLSGLEFVYTYGLLAVGVFFVPVVWAHIFEIYNELLIHEKN